MIPNEVVDKIRDSTDIVSLVSQYVTLKKAGANYKGLCPFHQEKTPSFTVHPGKQIFHCFGCGQGGNAFSFLMKKENMTFLDAVRRLAERAGIALPEEGEDSQEAARQARQREEILQVLELAAAWFGRHLKEGGEAEAARAYVKRRLLQPGTVERFRLGFAPASGQALQKAAQARGFGPELLLKAGLLTKNERGDVYGRFRDRLIFPIENAAGKIVGFGGRLLGEGEPKYLNSSESPVFSKGNLLYALPQAREAIGRRGQALLVEGYMDALACHQAGFSFAVATLGTAAGEGHARALKRYTDELLLLFDSDRAGLAAAHRASLAFLGAGFSVKVVVLEGAKDPDEFLKARGPKEFGEALDKAVEAPVFFIRAALAQEGLDARAPAAIQRQVAALPAKRRAEVLQSIFPLLAKYPTEMEVAGHLRQAAETLAMPVEAVLADFQSFRRGQGKAPWPRSEGEPGAPLPRAREAGQAPARPRTAIQSVERELLVLMVEHPQLIPRAAERLAGAGFSDPLFDEAARLLWGSPDRPVLELRDSVQAGNPELAGLLDELMDLPPSYHQGEEKALADLAARLRQERAKQELDLVLGRLQDDEVRQDPEEVKRLLAQSQELGRQIQALRRGAEY